MKDLSMEELKGVIGRNLVELRHAAGMTQSDLAAKLNYSDKAVSKWECGDAVPDILILTRIADLFGVKVDYLVTESHTKEEMPAPRERRRIRTVITLLSVMLIWLIATAVFVVCTIIKPGTNGIWLAFIYALAVSALVAFVLSCVWGWRLAQYLLLSLFMWSLILSLFLSYIVFRPFEFHAPWMFFLVGIPGQLIIALWPGLKVYLRFPKLKPVKKHGEDEPPQEENRE